MPVQINIHHFIIAWLHWVHRQKDCIRSNASCHSVNIFHLKACSISCLTYLVAKTSWAIAVVVISSHHYVYVGIIWVQPSAMKLPILIPRVKTRLGLTFYWLFQTMHGLARRQVHCNIYKWYKCARLRTVAGLCGRPTLAWRLLSIIKGVSSSVHRSLNVPYYAVMFRHV